VEVKVRAVGVCGSDVHYYEDGRIGKNAITAPLSPGHEVAGIVERLGAGVDDLKPGCPVAVEPGRACGECIYCVGGKYNLCVAMRFAGTPPTHGAYSEYFTTDRRFVHPVPETMTMAEAAMIEPLAVAVHAVDYVHVRSGDPLVVLGCGSIGLLVAGCARVAGAGRIWCVDKIAGRLELARSKYGATETLDQDECDVVRSIVEAEGGLGARFAFEAAGSAQTFQQALDVTRPGGTVVLIGICSGEEVPLDLHEARRKELVIQMARRFRFTYPRAIELAASGRVDVASLITHRFTLDRVEEAFALVSEYGDGVVKAVVEVPNDAIDNGQ
jgi:L-iditol 2-dehydrogenase